MPYLIFFISDSVRFLSIETYRFWHKLFIKWPFLEAVSMETLKNTWNSFANSENLAVVALKPEAGLGQTGWLD